MAREISGINISSWVLPPIVFLLAAVSLYFDAEMCTVPGHGVAIGATMLQFLAPWQAHFNGACSLTNVGVTTRWDLPLVVAYSIWLPFPVSWSIRRRARPAVDAGCGFSRWLLRLKW